MIADFWYTAWVDAGKPNLSGITNWSPEKKEQYATEKAPYQSNSLIKENLLEARKK